MTFSSLLRQPGAIIPLAMSAAAILLIIAVVSTDGVVPHQDEGAPARIFQLLIALQVPIVAYFAFKWLTRSRRPALLVLLVQAAAAFSAVAAVMWLESSVAA